MSTQSEQQNKTENVKVKADTGKSDSSDANTVAPPALDFERLSESLYLYKPPVNNFKRPFDVSGDAIGKSFNDVLQPIRPKRINGQIPRVILIMGWMDAPFRIVTKYAAPYALLFPTATIIIKLSDGISFMRGRKAQAESMGKVADLLCQAEASNEAKAALRQQSDELHQTANQAGLTLIEDYQDPSQNDEKVQSKNAKNVPQTGGMVIHNFSDGGSANLLQLLLQLRNKNAPQPLAHIIDSSPGKASPASGSNAMTMPLAKRPLIRFVVRVGVYMYLYFFSIFKRLFRIKGWSEIMRERLNTPTIWSWAQTAGIAHKRTNLPPRLYLYSKADKLIDYRAIEEHAALAAKSSGLKAPLQLQDFLDQDKDLQSSQKQEQGSAIVATKRWEQAAHCDIGRADFAGYWNSVRGFLEQVL